MISMTSYWQQFKDCIDALRTSTSDASYSNLFTTAETLIEIGLSIETLGITEIQQVSNQLYEKAKLFGHEIKYTEDKEYIFYLPKITNIQSLIFCILYYQHLTHYQHVSYQGTITWFKQMVIDGVNAKKISTAIQAKALLQEIKTFCKNETITIDESLFLKSPKESIQNYTSRIVTLFNKPEPINEEVKECSKLKSLAILEKSIKTLEYRINELTKKNELITQKIETFTEARKNHSRLTQEWKNKWFITRAIYRFLALFYEVSEIKNLQQAEKDLVQAKNELDLELPQHTPESYLEKLQKLQRRLSNEHKIFEGILLEKQQNKQEKPPVSYKKTQLVPHSEQIAPPSDIEESIPAQIPSSSNHDYYGFFKEYIPSKYTLQAIAVGTAAIVIQSL